MPECYIRGNTIKYLRVPDEVCCRTSFHLHVMLYVILVPSGFWQVIYLNLLAYFPLLKIRFRILSNELVSFTSPFAPSNTQYTMI